MVDKDKEYIKHKDDKKETAKYAFGKDIFCPLKKYISLEMAYDANQVQNVLTYDEDYHIFRYRKAEIVYKGKNHLHCFQVDSDAHLENRWARATDTGQWI